MPRGRRRHLHLDGSTQRKLLDQIPGVKELIITNESTGDPHGPGKDGGFRLADRVPGRQPGHTRLVSRQGAADRPGLGDAIAKESTDGREAEDREDAPGDERKRALEELGAFISEDPEVYDPGLLVDAVVELKRNCRTGRSSGRSSRRSSGEHDTSSQVALHSARNRVHSEPARTRSSP